MAWGNRKRARVAAEQLEGRQLLDAGIGVLGDPVAVVAPATVPAAVMPLDPTASPEPLVAAGTTVALVAAPEGISPGEEVDLAATSTVPRPTGTTRAADPSARQAAPKPVKRFAYVTNDRTHVVINLTGPGTLEGTRFDRDTNTLRLIYDNTTDTSQIIGHVNGGNGRANLAVLADADVPPNSQSGIGGNQVGLVALKAFRLVPGGRINLLGGVRKLKLHEVGPNTQVLLRSLPQETNRGQGQNTSFANSPLIGNELQLTDGTVIPVIFNTSQPPTNEPPPGVRVQIDRVSGTFVPTNTDAKTLAPLGNPQIFGYDAAAGQLLRFDAVTGQKTAQRTVPSLDSSSAGVSLGRFAGNLVVLVGQASTVRAFDALTLEPVGQFSTHTIADPIDPVTKGPYQFTSIDGLAKTDTQVAIVQGADASGPGQSILIDVTASLRAGNAIALSRPSMLPDGVQTTTGATGVAGYEAFAATALATFDQFQPTTLLPGFARLNTTRNTITQAELARSNVVPNPAPAQGQAVGSVDQYVAINQGVVPVGPKLVNRVSLVNRTSPTSERARVDLDYPTPLAGLSESYRPSLEGAALFDVQGDIQAFIVNRANGMVLNDGGVLNLLAIRRLSNSVVLGFPIVHVDVIARNNVALLSTKRPVGSRGGVNVNENLQPPGPLTLP